jgi:hypothetical protein
MRSSQTATTNANTLHGAMLSIAFVSGQFNGVARSKVAFFARSGCDLLSSNEDFLAACALAALEFPEKNHAQIIAVVTKKATQARAKSAICRTRIDQENEEGNALEIIAPDASIIDDYRLLDLAAEGEIDTIRARIQGEKNLTDRAARYRLARAAERASTADEDDLFGRAGYAAALKPGGAA